MHPEAERWITSDYTALDLYVIKGTNNSASSGFMVSIALLSMLIYHPGDLCKKKPIRCYGYDPEFCELFSLQIFPEIYLH